jgi:hypothetical protein
MPATSSEPGSRRCRREPARAANPAAGASEKTAIWLAPASSNSSSRRSAAWPRPTSAIATWLGSTITGITAGPIREPGRRQSMVRAQPLYACRQRSRSLLPA